MRDILAGPNVLNLEGFRSFVVRFMIQMSRVSFRFWMPSTVGILQPNGNVIRLDGKNIWLEITTRWRRCAGHVRHHLQPYTLLFAPDTSQSNDRLAFFFFFFHFRLKWDKQPFRELVISSHWSVYTVKDAKYFWSCYLWSLFWGRGYGKDKILDVYHNDACSWNYTICLNGLFKGITTKLEIFFPTKYSNYRHLVLMWCYAVAMQTFGAVGHSSCTQSPVSYAFGRQYFRWSFSSLWRRPCFNF